MIKKQIGGKMKGEIRIINELDQRKITNQTLKSQVNYDNSEVRLMQDGNIVMEGGQETCTSTTLSFVTSLKQETK